MQTGIMYVCVCMAAKMGCCRECGARIVRFSFLLPRTRAPAATKRENPARSFGATVFGRVR